MSKIEKKKSEDEESKEISSIPKSKVREILSELEVLSLQKGVKSSFDISKLDGDQFNNAIDLLKQNEQNAFDYHSKRLDVVKEIESKRIDSSVILQKTVRFVIISSVIILPIFTLLILFFKEDYFIPWLTFLTGFLGGAGFTKMLSSYLKRTQRNEPILDKDD
ncbi:MAG: hypothetical protein R6V36_00535 [Psychroflexus sp.]